MLSKGIFVSGSGPAVVFLHSSLSSSRQWQPLVAQLEGDFTCINIDILGYGAADKVADPDNYNFTVEAERINQAINTAIGDQPYHLVGHSCGGAIALKLAVEAPHRLLSLSLFEPVAFHLLPLGTEERAMADAFGQQVARVDNYKAAEMFTELWNRPGFFKALPPKMQASMANDMTKVVLDFKGLTSEQYTVADLGAIKAPSLFLTGKYSPALSHHLAEQIISGLAQVKSVEILAGHMAPISDSGLVLPLIKEFIEQHTGN